MFDQTNNSSDFSTSSKAPVIEELTLDIDLTKADLDYPQFPAQIIRARIVGAKVEPNKAQDGRNLVITFQNEQPITSTKGREFGVGKRTFMRYYTMQPSKKNPDWDWTAPLAELQLAATGRRDTALKLGEMASKEVYIKLKPDTEGRTGVDKVMNEADAQKSAGK